MTAERVTDRLVLRRWRVGDAARFAAINADPEVMRHIGHGHVLGRALSDDLIARFEEEWRERGYGPWAVAPRSEPSALLGFCGLTIPMFLPAVLPAVEIGWRFARDAWGCGYATESARSALEFAFEEHRMREVIAIVDPENARSLRVAEKLGMSPRPDRLHPVTRKRLIVVGTTATSYNDQ